MTFVSSIINKSLKSISINIHEQTNQIPIYFHFDNNYLFFLQITNSLMAKTASKFKDKMIKCLNLKIKWSNAPLIYT